MKRLLLAATMFVALAAPASAALILTFGQTGGANTITAAANALGTTWGGTDVPVTITQINAANSTPIAAFLDVSATSTIAGATTLGGAIVEHFTGTFSINAAANNTGTNYLAGTFDDGALTASGATAIAVFAPTTTFNSDVITTLELPRSLSFALTNVTPPVSLVAAGGTTSGLTIADFAASVAGNASASAVPEPLSLAVLGMGLFGLGMVKRSRS